MRGILNLMCGIAGIFDYSGANKRFDASILKKMGEVIHHRGPDSGGEVISESHECGMAFRRLAIIDLSDAGNQPMYSADSRYKIVFNGEIYNHVEIRKELQAKAYSYKSHTDTETILNGYAEFGEDILKKMIGMWAFALWDQEKRELFIARDRIGIKPLYYYHRDGMFIFASEIKSILQHPDVKRELNLSELPNYLNLGMSSANETLFNHIKKIPAAHSLRIKSSGEYRITRYWSPFESPATASDMSDTEIQSHLVSLLRGSVKSRMMSDVPFGVFLSGGVDSSLNVALMDELMDRPVDTFTVGFKELEKYNELEYARKISDLYKTNHHEVLIDRKSAFDVLEDIVWHTDEPNADPVCIPLFHLSKLTHDAGTVVVQVGEGSDEQFTGYKWMMRDWRFYNSYWRAFNYLPGILKKSLYQITKPLLMARFEYLALDYLRRAAYDLPLYMSGVSVLSGVHQQQLLKDFELADIPYDYARDLHEEALRQHPKADYLQRMLFLELGQRLAEMLLMRVDKMGMAHSIEARVPFLDHRIVEFSMSLSAEQRAPKGKTTKYQLKKAVEGILPHEIIYRKKMGFAAPVREWLRDQWYDYARETVLNSPLIGEHCDIDFAEKLFKIHRKGLKNTEREIYSLLMLALWDRKFLS